MTSSEGGSLAKANTQNNRNVKQFKMCIFFQVYVVVCNDERVETVEKIEAAYSATVQFKLSSSPTVIQDNDDDP
jgi:hypothetical protein